MLLFTQVSRMIVNLLYLSPKQQEVSRQCFPWVLGDLKLNGSFFKSHDYACKGPILKGIVGWFESLIGIGHMEVLHILVPYLGGKFLKHHIEDEHETFNLQVKLNSVQWNPFFHLQECSIHENSHVSRKSNHKQ